MEKTVQLFYPPLLIQNCAARSKEEQDLLAEEGTEVRWHLVPSIWLVRKEKLQKFTDSSATSLYPHVTTGEFRKHF